VSQKDNIAKESIFILVITISFFWVGYASLARMPA